MKKEDRKGINRE